MAVSSFWEQALDTLETSILLFDPHEDRILQFNDAVLRLTGFSGYDFSTLRVSNLFPGALSGLTGLSLEALATGSAWSQDLSVRTQNGVNRPVELALSSFGGAERPFLSMTLRDLRTLRKRQAQTEFGAWYRNLGTRKRGTGNGENRTGEAPIPDIDDVFRRLERGSQLILDAAGEGIYGVDTDGLTTFVNPAAERMLGWKAEELIGRNAHDLMHHSHRDGTGYPIKACPIYAAFRDGRVHRVTDEVFWRKDGNSFPVEYMSTPIEEQGKLLGAVVVFRDVSGQRKSREDLLRALEEVDALRKRLELENAYLQEELGIELDHREIVGKSPAIMNVLRQIEMVAPSDTSVLITGESGTGKELIARAIHNASPRRDRPLIRVNCASIPRELFESEFFGHARGAFTGAVTERIGRFELADRGTIFLDEVGELPLEHQAKLLRILQEKQFERVGETRTRETDVRVIAATNRDLAAGVREKHFREDLYFRLNVFPVELPPLRERPEDIPLLAPLFLKRAITRLNRPGLRLSLGDAERLRKYHWPGNIRELENVIERAVITSTDGRLRLHVPETLLPPNGVAPAPAPDSPEKPGAAISPPPPAASAGAGAAPGAHAIMTEPERIAAGKQAIEAALRASNGRVSGKGGAAERMALKPTTLYSRLRKFGIEAKDFKS